MKSKTLVITNGVVGLVGGIVLLFGIWFIGIGAVNDAANGTGGSAIGMSGALDFLKIAILVLGIIAAIYYKGDARVGIAPSVLLIVGGAIALVPFLGWIGGIVSIVGGSLYLAKIKNFKA